MAKGLELPVNVLVVIAVAVIVLLGVVALYLVGFGGPAGGITLQAITTNACQNLVRQGNCGSADAVFNVQISNFDANQDGKTLAGTTTPQKDTSGKYTIITSDNLGALCMKYYGVTYDPTKLNDFRNSCNVRVCGCSA